MKNELLIQKTNTGPKLTVLFNFVPYNLIDFIVNYKNQGEVPIRNVEVGQMLDFPYSELDTSSFIAHIHIDGRGDTTLSNTSNLREDVNDYHYSKDIYYYITDTSKDAYGVFS